MLSLLQLKFLLHRVRHLASYDFSRLIALLDGRLENQAFLLHAILVILQNHYLTVLLPHAFRLEIHFQLHLLQLLYHFLLRVGCPRVLGVKFTLLFLELRSQLAHQLVVLED